MLNLKEKLKTEVGRLSWERSKASGIRVTIRTSWPLTCIHKHCVPMATAGVFRDEVQILK